MHIRQRKNGEQYEEDQISTLPTPRILGGVTVGSREKGRKWSKLKQAPSRPPFLKLKKEPRTLLANFLMIRLAWSGSAAWVIFNMVDIIINPLRNLAIDVLLIGYIYNAVQQTRSFNELAPFFVILCAFYLVNILFEAVMIGYVNPMSEIRIRQHIDKMICQNAAAIPLASYDDASFYEGFIFSTRNCYDTVKEATINLASFIAYLLGGILGISMISGIHPIMIVFVVVSILISLLLASRKKKLELKFHEEISKVHVQEEYIHRVFYTKDYAKEIRCQPSLLDFMLSKFSKIEDKNTELTKRYSRKKMLYGIGGIVNNRVLMYWAIMILTIGLIAVTGTVEPGNLLIMTVSVGTVSLLIGAIVGTIPKMGQIALYYRKLRTFMSKGTKEITDTDKVVLKDLESICFEHVSFTYPNEERAVLTDVSFMVRRNERLVLVGENGSGKSTVIKLILGFYRPSAGKIEVNGINLADVDLPSYRKLFGCVFQDVNLYAWSAEQNITISESKADDQTLRRIVKASGLTSILRTGEDFERNMTREISEDGLVLSHGNRQRIAIARALYPNVSALLFDEMTSAIDPETETAIMSDVERAGMGKITVYISHKLSCVKNANHIVFLENGRVVEEGDHRSLIQNGGRYYSMFKAQSYQFAQGQRLKGE